MHKAPVIPCWGGGRFQQGEMQMADENEIKAGDVVWLKSGGPAMTVTAISPEDHGREEVVVCRWFTADQVKPETGEFPRVALRTSDPIQ
jgi:uncharacterized protein YodC (DUF2158 family)